MPLFLFAVFALFPTVDLEDNFINNLINSGDDDADDYVDVNEEETDDEVVDSEDGEEKDGDEKDGEDDPLEEEE